jgi:hypothetical protein
MNALQDGVAIATKKAFSGTTNSYSELSPEEVAARNAAEKEGKRARRRR